MRLIVIGLLWPLSAIGNFFLFFAKHVAAPTEPRRSVGFALIIVASTFINGYWSLVADIRNESNS